MRLTAVTVLAALSCTACSGSTDTAAACDDARDAFGTHLTDASGAKETARRAGFAGETPDRMREVHERTNPEAVKRYGEAVVVWNREAKLVIAVVQGNADCFTVEERAQVDALSDEYQ